MKYTKTIGFAFGTFVGSIIGLCIALWMSKETTLKSDEAYALGRKNAQRECVELIKSTKP